MRERANTLLNTIRMEFEPVALVGALNPRILDLPERTKTAVVQFLCVVVPHCGCYFEEGKNMWAFLGRMACVLGALGTKPTPALLAAGSRLLELSYNAAPAITIEQLSLLPLGQQNLLKRLLLPQVPQIDALVGTVVATIPSTDNVRSPSPLALREYEKEETPVYVKEEGEGSLAFQSQTETIARAPSPLQTKATTVHPGDLASPISTNSRSFFGEEPQRSPAVAKTSLTNPVMGDNNGLLHSSPQVLSSSTGKSNTPTQGIAEAPTQTLRTSPVTVTIPTPAPPTPAAVPAKSAPHRTPPPVPVPTTMGVTPGAPLSRDIDMMSILNALGPHAPRDEKVEAVKVIRRLARAKSEVDPGIDHFWHANCAQIVSVLLEAFSPHHADAVGDTNVYGASTSAHGGAEISPIVENMHTVCKVLLMLVKYRADHIRAFTDLLASRLCQAAVFAPVAVTLHCEQILMDLAKLDGLRMLRIIVPFAQNGNGKVNVNLLALHVIAETLKCIPSSQLLLELHSLVSVALPSLTSDVVDLRKAVIFVLVEAYMVVGDALYPFVKDLAPPQKKLLTIYIDRALSDKKQAV